MLKKEPSFLGSSHQSIGKTLPPATLEEGRGTSEGENIFTEGFKGNEGVALVLFIPFCSKQFRPDSLTSSEVYSSVAGGKKSFGMFMRRVDPSILSPLWCPDSDSETIIKTHFRDEPEFSGE